MRHNPLVTALAALLRAMPRRGRGRLVAAARVLPCLGQARSGRRRIGPMSLLLDPRDQFQSLMLVDRYEEFTTRLIRDLLRPGDVYVDVGAQLGYTAAHAAQRIGPTGTMVLIEPDPTALSRLEEHLATAGEGMPKVHLVKAACSRGSGMLRFHVSPIVGHSRIIAEGELPEGGRIVETPVRSIDDILEELCLDNVRMLKMDVEGHEIPALCGLQRSLASARIDVLLLEKNQTLFDDPALDTSILCSLLMIHGYSGFHEESRHWITRATMGHTDAPIENLVFARDTGLLDAYTSSLHPDTPNIDFLRRHADVALVHYQSDATARAIVAMARSGRLSQAIEEALQLIKSTPELFWLQGHLAWWLLESGDTSMSINLYKAILEVEPTNKEVAARLRELGHHFECPGDESPMSSTS